MMSDDVVEQLNLPKLGQIGYVVGDIDEAVAFCRDAFGIRPWLLTEERPNPCFEKGKRIYPVLRIGLAYAGPVQIELIQVTEGEPFYLDHIREGREGPHHVGYMVRELDKRLDACNALGIGVIHRGTIRESGLKIDYAYLDTVETAGMVLELIQWRLGPIGIPVNRSVHNLVTALGSWTLFRGRVIK